MVDKKTQRDFYFNPRLQLARRSQVMNIFYYLSLKLPVPQELGTEEILRELVKTPAFLEKHNWLTEKKARDLELVGQFHPRLTELRSDLKGFNVPLHISPGIPHPDFDYCLYFLVDGQEMTENEATPEVDSQ